MKTKLLGLVIALMATTLYADNAMCPSGNREYTEEGKYLGKIMKNCPLKGTWVGIGITLAVEKTAVKRMNAAHMVCYIYQNGFIMCKAQGGDGLGNFVNVPTYTGYLRQAAPQIFTYNVGNPDDAGYGCALYEIITNRNFDQATGVALADDGCRMSPLYWEQYNFYKISDTIDPSKLGDSVEIANQWISE